MSIITPELLRRILNGYALPPLGAHGVTHWARVLENARKIAQQVGADEQVVELFAVFHDARRRNEAIDPGHGRRGFQLARELRGAFFELDDGKFALLEHACNEHTSGFTSADLSVQACWDADRLDLLRVGIRPDPRYLCTQAAKDASFLEWANARARQRYVPALIQQEWGLDFENPGWTKGN
jgi:uncharacterized protein